MIVRSLAALAALPLGALIFAAPAHAQEADPWSGFYVGANLGGAWGDTSSEFNGASSTIIPPGDLPLLQTLGSSSSNNTNFTGGVEGGFNVMLGSVLLGIETDYGFFNVDQKTSKTATSTVTINPPGTAPTFIVGQDLTTDWIWTLRPRIGWANEAWMIYATGGLATTKVKYNITYSDTRIPPNNASLAINDTKSGWTAGVGGAWAFAPGWSVKGEYLYANFGNIRGSVNTPGGAVALTSSAKVNANIVRMGVDYTF